MSVSMSMERSRIGGLLEQSRIALVALVDGTIAQLDADTQSMLRTRLRLSAMILFIGFAVFLAANLIWQTVFAEQLEAYHSAFLGFHAGITAVLGFVWLIIAYRRTRSILRLRSAELIVFGLPMVFFLAFQYFEMYDLARRLDDTSLASRISSPAAQGNQVQGNEERAAADGSDKGTSLGGSEESSGGRVEAVSKQNADEPEKLRFFSFRDGLWLMLMFTYALFIPNPFRRAASVIGFMAAAPIVLMFVMVLVHPSLREVVTADQLLYYPLLLAFCAVGSVFGVQTIDTLRHEAYEARQLGHYRLSEQIGAGGMGEVYLAEHQLLKRPCVIKLIKPDKAGDQKVLARFKREVRATSKLTHWNTVDIFDYGSTAEGVFYYVMEYLPGLSLGEIVERYGPMPPARVIHVLQQACDALCEAHARGLVHRDIKPGNIFLAERGGVYDVAKLLDFGLVKPLADEDAMALTTEGAIIGSPLYMSPEQATGKGHPESRSDIYSLGAVAYYLLTGRPPFQGDNPVQVIMAHASQDPEPPTTFRADVPADLEEIVLKCLSKSPDERYQTVLELRAKLLACEDAGHWSRESAAQWWKERDLPKTPGRRFEEDTSRVAAGAQSTQQ
jgi:tRNA A-37 threonylcarbamoyl transferase component Bud32